MDLVELPRAFQVERFFTWFSFFLLSFLTLTNFSLVSCVKPIEVAEVCSSNFITQDYDGAWDHSNKTINSTVYFPMTTKYTALLLAKNLFETQEFETIKEAQLEKSCIALKRLSSWQTTNITGYNGKSTVMLMTPTTVPRLYRFNFGFPDVVNGGGYASVALSDNESYNLFDFCFDNGLRSFAVASTKRSLDANTRNIIRAHVKSLGFQEKNFLTLNYNDCSEQHGVLMVKGKDLPKPMETPAVLLYRANLLLAKKYNSAVSPTTYLLRG